MRTWFPITITTISLLAGCGGTDSAGTSNGGGTDMATTVVDTAVDSTVGTTVPGSAATSSTPGGSGAPDTTAVPQGPAALEPETDAERAAVASAASTDGRRWATGNYAGTEQAAGEPFLAGYTVLVTDGANDYTVAVLGTTAVPYFASGDVPYISQATGILHPVPAATPRQTAAVEAGVAWVAAAGIDVTGVGIEAYRVMFPSNGDATATLTFYPSVEVYADQTASMGVFASGGPDAR